jgi:hypothetical protein
MRSPPLARRAGLLDVVADAADLAHWLELDLADR